MSLILCILPINAMAQYSDIYGAAFTGGAHDAGFLFKMNPDGGDYQIIHDFDGIHGGNHPTGMLAEGPDGRIYGTTILGGLNDRGVIFAYDPTYDTFNVEYHLEHHTGISLTLASDGKFYSISTSNSGMLVSYDPLNKTYEIVDNFPTSEGRLAFVESTLTLVGDSRIYGIARGGGNSNTGTLFEYDINTDTFTVKHHFGADGSRPDATLVHLDNKLYGRTQSGGDNGRGVIFEYDLSTDAYSAKQHLDAPHLLPEGIALGPDDNLYLTDSIGGSLEGGAVIKFDPANNTLEFVHEFADLGNPHIVTGSLMGTYSGKMYGLTRYGGTGLGLGTIFEYDLASESASIIQSLDDGFPIDTVLLEVGERTVTSLTIDAPANIIDTDNGALQLTATVLPSEASGQPLEWSSDNTTIATVSSDGLVTARSNGVVNITATANFGLGVEDTITITISNQDATPPIVLVDSISITGPSDRITSFSGTLQLDATALPVDASDRSLSWSVSDTNVATVSSTGLVSPVGAGSVVVTATANDGSGISANKTIEVTNHITSITITPSTNKIETHGDTIDFDAIILPADATNQSIAWSVDNPVYATIDDDGVLTANANGAVTVTAQTQDGSSIQATREVTIDNGRIEVIFVTILPLDETITTDEGTLQFTASIYPSDATDPSVTWSSSDESVATVDQTGLVTAKGNGITNILAQSPDGPSMVRELTISNQSSGPIVLEGIAFDPSTVYIAEKDGTLQLSPQFLPANHGESTDLNWIKGGVAGSVSSDGLVTASENGQINVTAYTTNLLGETVYGAVTVIISNQNDPIYKTPVELERVEDKWQLSHTRDTSLGTFSYSYVVSEDLQNWTPLTYETDYTIVTTTDHGSGIETLVIELLDTNTETLFLRVVTNEVE